MKWDDFAVQIEDPQPGGFQLGYVNLPTAEIPGVEAEFAFAVNDALAARRDARLERCADVSEATVLTLVRRRRATSSRFTVQNGARLPLTPDWTATLGIECGRAASCSNAQPFARFDVAYVGESVN